MWRYKLGRNVWVKYQTSFSLLKATKTKLGLSASFPWYSEFSAHDWNGRITDAKTMHLCLPISAWLQTTGQFISFPMIIQVPCRASKGLLTRLSKPRWGRFLAPKKKQCDSVWWHLYFRTRLVLGKGICRLHCTYASLAEGASGACLERFELRASLVRPKYMFAVDLTNYLPEAIVIKPEMEFPLMQLACLCIFPHSPRGRNLPRLFM